MPMKLVDDVVEILHNPAFRDVTRHLNHETKVALATYVALRRENICISPRCLEGKVVGSRNLFTDTLRALGVPSCEPFDYLLYVSKKMGLDPAVAGNALWIILKILNRFPHSGSKTLQPARSLSRSALTAGAVYEAGYAKGVRVLMKDLAGALCISEVSVRNATRYVRERLGGETRMWIEEAGREEVGEVSAEAFEGLMLLKLVFHGESRAITVFKKSSGDEWVKLARALSIPIEGLVQLVDIVNKSPLDLREIALEKSLAYLAMAGALGIGDYRMVWCENQALMKMLMSKGFRVAGMNPYRRSPVVVTDLNLLRMAY
ncbi:hypothetical protein [Thermosphaera aggregans]|uniref:hypothetical protein n=1 Tax=Thermosphaera aggregans TaxID=54254 RepID=UPI003C779D93